ncbi:MAG: bifunctional glutamate N-acetyltransferase/amino-acid acetyltransferase ArgJ [Acidobacteriota bacterium]|nr:bifunctional glutamate N-acetyltransferase/amino-acid acetyltransferase ArgJ [Acidobacteriota bacterium]
MNLPLGYRYASTFAGIRNKEQDDLALIVSGIPASAAAVFTQNRVQAAPVKLARKNVRSSHGQAGAVLINAGNANCATRTGDRVALVTCASAAKLLRLPPNQVIPASTGVIGVELDPKLILNALPKLVKSLSDSAFDQVARAIMTTDLVPKQASIDVPLRRATIRIAGMTKGSGMIHPRMATMLGFVMTDAQIPPAVLRRMLQRGSDSSYNRISVDGDTSTNDTLLLLANGASGVRPDPKEMVLVEEGIASVMQSLAKMIARDGEGAKKLITIHVSGAANDGAAATIARSIANSPLVKSAVGGADPNWGRIICAAGYAGVPFDAAKVDIHLQGTVVCLGGLAAPYSEPELKEKLDAQDCEIRFEIRGNGKGSATFWTCDLTEDYIRINGSYRT